MALAPPEWADQAVCRTVPDPDQFFPERGASTKAAKALCAACPLKQKCLDHAVEQPEIFGIWGGTSERERRVLRVERKRGRLSA